MVFEVALLVVSFSSFALKVSFDLFILHYFELSNLYITQDFIPLDVIATNASQTVSIFRSDGISDLWCAFCFFFFVKHNWARNKISVYCFSGFGGYSMFGSAYFGLYFFGSCLQAFFITVLFKEFEGIYTNRTFFQ